MIKLGESVVLKLIHYLIQKSPERNFTTIIALYMLHCTNDVLCKSILTIVYFAIQPNLHKIMYELELGQSMGRPALTLNTVHSKIFFDPDLCLPRSYQQSKTFVINKP